MNINRMYGGHILKITIGISLLAILLLVSSAGASTSSKIAYVNYDDSGFTGSGVLTHTGSIFDNAIVGAPPPTGSSTDPVTYNGMTFTPIKRSDVNAATLANYDTLILYEICDISTVFTASQLADINSYFAAGHKILLFDADRCAPIGSASTSAGQADYSWFTFPFATSSPGAQGKTGILTVSELSTLTTGTPLNSINISLDPFSSDELGDANTATSSDNHWCAAAQTTNTLGNTGFWLAYARFKGKGLIIYNGADNWFSFKPTQSLTDTFLNMLNQQFNPDGLPCTIGLAPKGSIAGTKFNDLNGDGIRQAGEPGINGWTITLTNDSGGVTTQTTAPSPDGSYNFTNLTDGNYTVGEVLLPGWIQTAPAVSKTGSATYKVQIQGGNNVIGEDFGNFQLGSISGTKFNDLDGNSAREPTEPGIAGWNITINGTDTITGETVLQTTTTDANGNYSFTNLTAGTYTISEQQKSGWVETEPAVSTTDSATYTENIATSGTSITGQDFGNFFDIPTASCVKGVNPAGNIPPANGGQRPDGFYQLLATDKFDPSPQIFVKDMGSGTIFPVSPPGFASGTYIKYTQAPGATPSIVPFSGAVSWHITGTGDAGVYAVNFVGNPSPIVSCLVPPPPK